MTVGTCDDDNARRIREFLEGLLQHMNSPAQVNVVLEEKGRYQVTLEGEKLGQLIGRRGETLDAIQQLTNYAVNSGADKRIRVHVDAENYRAKREQSLESLARKVAGKVTKYRRSVTLEPMNAYERHVIHAALQDEPGITTYSIGSEPNRRVVVSYDRRQRKVLQSAFLSKYGAQPKKEPLEAVAYPVSQIVPLDELFMQKLVGFMEENYSNPGLRVNDLAEFMNMSRSVFNRKVNRSEEHTSELQSH